MEECLRFLPMIKKNLYVYVYVYVYSRIMHVMPWGQKKPSQHGLQLRVLEGISFVSLRLIFCFSPTEHAHPGSQPETHEVRLQFLFSVK